MDARLEIALFVFVGIAIFIGAFWMFTTEKRLKKFFLGKKGKDLEDTIDFLEQTIIEIKKTTELQKRELEDINAKLKKSVRGLKTIRFNPFPDQGGNQSFAIGMLNEEGDGVVISSLYSRDRMSVFAKPVVKHKSEYELSDEEKDVLAQSKVS